MQWLTPADRDTIETLWPDVEAIEDPVLSVYLTAAAEACEAFAPQLAEGKAMPEGWKLAQVMQARNIWNSGAAAPGGDFDGSGYGITAHPLDWQVKQLLRPRRALGAIV